MLSHSPTLVPEFLSHYVEYLVLILPEIKEMFSQFALPRNNLPGIAPVNSSFATVCTPFTNVPT
jgi:hypothetical protein